ncbi:MAG: glucosamine-6-phosphate deaminase [Planctomycetota bacterium]
MSSRTEPSAAAHDAASRSLASEIAVTVTTRVEAERAVARLILDLVEARRLAGDGCALGLATGGTMVGVYAALVELAVAEGASFEHVATVNLDEYLGLGPEHPQSFAAFMHAHLFGPLAERCGLALERTLVPDGLLAASDPIRAARLVEARIAELGGLDLQLLGIGRNGHLAFNEPGASHRSRTRVVALARATREDAAATFGGLAEVPRRALTMGLGTILDARRLAVLAFGAGKAEAVRTALSGPIDRARPASALRRHRDVSLWLDAEAASRRP